MITIHSTKKIHRQAVVRFSALLVTELSAKKALLECCSVLSNTKKKSVAKVLLTVCSNMPPTAADKSYKLFG